MWNINWPIHKQIWLHNENKNHKQHGKKEVFLISIKSSGDVDQGLIPRVIGEYLELHGDGGLNGNQKDILNNERVREW